MPNIGTTSRLAFIATLDATRFLRGSELLSDAFGKLAKSAVSFGQGLSRSLSLLSGIIEGFAVKAATDFNRLEATLGAIVSGDGLKALVSDARQLGRTSKFTSKEVLDLQLSLAKLGFETEDIQSATRSAIDVTTVFGGNLKNVAASIAEVSRQFGDIPFQVVADKFAVAFRGSALGVENFSEAFRNVGAIASAANVDFDRVVATLAALANQGQKSAKGGTRLKSVFNELTKAGFDVSEGLLAVEGSSIDLPKLFEFFKSRGAVAAAAINALGLEIETYVESLNDSTGASRAFASQLEDELFYQVDRVKAGIEDLGITIGNAFKQQIAGIANFIELLGAAINSTDQDTLSLTATLGTIAVAIGPVIFALGQLTIAVKALLTGTGALVAGLVAVAGYLTYVALDFTIFNQRVDEGRDSLKDWSETLARAGGNIRDVPLPQLEAQLASLNKQLEEGGGLSEGFLADIQQRIDDLNDAANREVGVGSLGFGVGGGAFVDPANTASGRQAAAAEADLKKQRVERNKALARAFLIQKEIERRLADQVAKAKERLQLTKDFAGILNGVTLTKETDDLLTKGLDKLATNAAKFGTAIEDIAAVGGDIDNILGVNLRTILEGKFPKDILGEVLPKGTLEEQASALEGNVKALEFLAEGFAKIKQFALAKIFDDLAKSARRAFDDASARAFVDEVNRATRLEPLDPTLIGADPLRNAIRDAEKELRLYRSSLDKLASNETFVNQERGWKIIKAEIDSTIVKINEAAVSLGNLNLDRVVRDAKELRSLGEAPIFNPFASSNRAQQTQRTIRALQNGIGNISKQLKSPDAKVGADAVNEALLEQSRLVDRLNDAYNEFEVNTFLDSVGNLNEELQALNIESGFGLTTPLESVQNELSAVTTRLQQYQAMLARGVTPTKEAAEEFERLKRQAAALAIEVRNLIRAEQTVQFLFTTVQDLATAFADAKRSGEDFGEALRDNLEQVLVDITVRLASLIVMFGILKAVAGGSGDLAKYAKFLTEGGLGSFVGSNLIGGGGLQPGQGLNVGTGNIDNRVAISGSISGNQIILVNQRGTRALDRTFG